MMAEDDELREAVKNGDIDKIHRLADGVEGRQIVINKEYVFGNTVLHEAARSGHSNVVQLLVEWGARINQRNQYGNSPLHEAVQLGHLEVVQLLVDEDAVVNQENMHGYTPLHWAAKINNLEIVEFLINHGAEINTKSKDGKTPLHIAIETNVNMHVVKILLEKEADVNAVNKDGENALFTVIRHGIHNTAVDDISVKVKEAIEVVELLLTKNINMDCKNKQGLTPLTLLDRTIGVSESRRKAYYKKIKEFLLETKREREYSALMYEHGVDVQTVKLYICGHGGVGKTTLKDSLQRDDWSLWSRDRTAPSPGQDKHTPTAGIDVSTTNIPNAGQFSLWDFAGQSEFYVTHNMVLSAENTTFVVVYKIADWRKNGSETVVIRPLDVKEDQQDKVNYWLRFIKATDSSHRNGSSEGLLDDGKPTVILVASRADWLTDQNMIAEAHFVAEEILTESKRLFGGYLNICDKSFVMNCHKSQHPNMNDLRDELRKRRKVILQRAKAMPNICNKILEAKESWAQSVSFPILSWEDYSSRGRQIAKGIDDELLKTATSYLHNIGEVILVKGSNMTSSQDLVILQPQKFCSELIGPVLATDFAFYQFKRRLLPGKERYSKQDIESVFRGILDIFVVLHLLQEFELLFPMSRELEGTEDTEYIIPSLLKAEMPEEQWQVSRIKQIYYGRSFRCKSKVDSFSPGFFPRLQTRIYKHLSELNRPPSSIWRNGIKINYRVEGMLYITKDRQAVHVFVRAEKGEEIGECYQLLELMTADVYDMLNLSCPGTDVEMRILSALSLREHNSPEDFRSYPLQEIFDAYDNDGIIYDGQLGRSEKILDLLCAGHDRTFLHRKGQDCDVQWMLRKSRERLCHLMDIESPVQHDIRLIADYIGINDADRRELEQKASAQKRSKTDVILEDWSKRWAKRKEDAAKHNIQPTPREEGLENTIYHESSIDNLKKILNDENVCRHDASRIINEMYKMLETIPRDSLGETLSPDEDTCSEESLSDTDS